MVELDLRLVGSVSYQLWFYVSVPSAQFETPHMRVNVTSASGLSHATEFLSVDHVTGLRLGIDDDVILTGRRDVTAASDMY